MAKTMGTKSSRSTYDLTETEAVCMGSAIGLSQMGFLALRSEVDSSPSPKLTSYLHLITSHKRKFSFLQGNLPRDTNYCRAKPVPSNRWSAQNEFFKIIYLIMLCQSLTFSFLFFKPYKSFVPILWFLVLCFYGISACENLCSIEYMCDP